MRHFLERSLLSKQSGLFLINLLTLISVGFTVYHTTNHLVETIQQEIQTQQTVEVLQQTLMLVTDAETGRRGYGFTQQKRFLNPYYAAIADLDSTLNELQSRVAIDPQQQANFNQLQNLIQQRLILLREAINLQRKTLDLNTQIQLSDRGKVIHDQIRRAIAHMQKYEQSRLQQLSAQSQNWSRLTLLSLLAGIGLSLLLFTLTYRLLNRQMRAYQQSQAALARNEEQLRMALEAARIGMWDWNLETGEINWSKEHVDLFGLTSNGFDGQYKTFEDRLHPDDREALNRAVTQALTDCSPYHHEYRVVWPDGSIHWVEGRGQAFYTKAGAPVRMSGTVMAIDQHKQAELALQESEAKHRLLFERNPQPMWVYDTETLAFLAVNETAVGTYGYSREEFLGMTIADIRPVEDVPRLLQSVTRFIGQGFANMGEWRHRKQDGSLIQVEIFASNVVWFNRPARVILARDITIEKQTAAALNQFNQELEKRVVERTTELQQAAQEIEDLYNRAPCGYHSLDAEGRFVRINQTELDWLGYKAEELLGKKFTEFISAEEVLQFQENFPKLKQQGWIHDLEFHLQCKDGSLLPVSISGTAVQDADGNFIMTRTSLFDLRERKRIEAEQQRIAHMKNEFVSMVSHELRTPLTAVYGALNLLSENLVPPSSEQGQRVIHIATENAERLVNLVNDILNLERLESGKISLQKRLCSAASLLTNTVNLNQLLASRTGISLQISAADVETMMDRDRILQVLTNLLSNAIKFSPSGSTIWLRAEVGDAEMMGGREDRKVDERRSESRKSVPPLASLLFSVTDQGRGIPADKLESIFERFQQVAASDARKSGGTGLGLAICRSIVQQHGGQIWAESTVGEGSTFYFTIPLG